MISTEDVEKRWYLARSRVKNLKKKRQLLDFEIRNYLIPEIEKMRMVVGKVQKLAKDMAEVLEQAEDRRRACDGKRDMVQAEIIVEEEIALVLHAMEHDSETAFSERV